MSCTCTSCHCECDSLRASDRGWPRPVGDTGKLRFPEDLASLLYANWLQSDISTPWSKLSHETQMRWMAVARSANRETLARISPLRDEIGHMQRKIIRLENQLEETERVAGTQEDLTKALADEIAAIICVAGERRARAWTEGSQA